MTWQDQYQQEGSAAELFQRYVVPRITSLWAKDLVDRACVQVGESVLDVACGTGVVTRLAAQQSGNGRVVGLDLNADMLRVARGVAHVCPSSDDLRQIAGSRKGGSGSSVIEIMRHAVDAASDGLRLSVA
jgi:SAM-dependent methyltransferase